MYLPQHSTINPVGSNINGANFNGGTSSILNKITSFLNWKVALGILFGILLIVISYYMYKSFADGKTSFYANRENMPSDSNSNKTATLMIFYADWCPVCKDAKPEWEAIKEEYDGKNVNGYTIHFVDHNCTTETEEINQLMDKYNIEGYPTVKLVKDNQIIEYDAKVTKSTLAQFLNTVL